MRSVPPAQRKITSKKGDVEINMHKWIVEVAQGTEKIIESGRITSPTAIADLRHCVRLLTNQEPTPFAWDISFYTSYQSANVPNESKQNNLVPSVVGAPEQPFDDSDCYHRPVHRIDDHYLLHLERPPFWAFGRFFVLSCVLLSCLFFSRPLHS